MFRSTSLVLRPGVQKTVKTRSSNFNFQTAATKSRTSSLPISGIYSSSCGLRKDIDLTRKFKIPLLSRSKPLAMRSSTSHDRGESVSSNRSSNSTPAQTSKYDGSLWFKILQRFEGIRYPPLSFNWWLDKLIVFFVFGVTGSSTLFFVRPLLSHVLGLSGTMIDGPWSYRIAAIFLITPAYTALLMTFGTLFGRREFFGKLATKMWGRFIPALNKKSSEGKDKHN